MWWAVSKAFEWTVVFQTLNTKEAREFGRLEQIRLLSNPGVEVVLRRSAQAKRLSLRVSRLDGRVTMTLPRGVPLKTAQTFADEKAEWIGKAIDKSVLPVELEQGAMLPLEGRVFQIAEAKTRSARVIRETILAPVGREVPAIKALFKTLARSRLSDAVERYTHELGETPGRLTLRDTRSRWGSCTSDGNLMFSWRLIMAPPEVLDYVAAHEVAHLVHMDHSKAFWTLVDDLYPGFETQRKWLRKNGPELHRYQFN